MFENALAKAATIALAAALAGSTGCALGGDVDVGLERSEIGDGTETYRLCSSMGYGLRGLEVAVYMVKDEWSLVALQHKGRVLCLDEPQTLRSVGVIPIERTTDPPCSFCQGTPLPASLILADDEDEPSKSAN
jgi:hypothetical protein